MKKLIILTILVLFVSVIQAQNWTNLLKSENPTFFEIQDAFNKYWQPYNVLNGKYTKDGKEKKAYGWKQFKRWEWFWEPRVDKNGLFPASNINFNEWQNYLNTHPKVSSNSNSSISNWTYSGSDSSTGGYAGIGRLNCIAFHPTDSNIFFVGSAGGGLWKTSDAGITWNALTDNIPVLSISDIAIDHNNPNIIYIATGDADGFLIDSSSSYSVGVLKTIDGGVNWNTTGLSSSPMYSQIISRLLIDPNNSDILYAGTSVGIFKTTDASVNWTQFLPDENISDMEFRPNNSNQIYATTKKNALYNYSKFYVSYNQGQSWDLKKVFSSPKTKIAVSSNLNAWLDIIAINYDYGLEGLYYSSDSGLTINKYLYPDTNCSQNYLASEYNGGSAPCDGQGNYDLAFAINPYNYSEIWIGGINTWKSNDYGSTWTLNNFCNYNYTDSTRIGYNPDSVQVQHADKHFFAFHPITNDLYECNDGGLYVTSDGGSSWNDISNGLGIGQIYRISTSATQSDNVICGLQDNGTKELSSGNWNDVVGGDGMECIIDYTNSSIKYASSQLGIVFKTTDNWLTGSVIVRNDSIGIHEKSAWITPYLMHPYNSNTLIIGKSQVFETTDGGTTWTQKGNIPNSSMIKSMAYAPSNPLVIYIATKDSIYKTIDGGNAWSLFKISDKTITYLCVDPNDENRLWVSNSGYDSNDKVWLLDSIGNPTNYSGTSLPNVPVNCIIHDNSSNNGLYIGTDLGVYYRNDTITDWIYFSTNMPNVVVNELEISYINSKIWAGTYGRGLWQCDIVISGCTDPLALNYDPNASLDDGDCTYSSNCTSPKPDGLYAYDVIDTRAKVGWNNMNDSICMVWKYFVRYREVGTSGWTTKSAGVGNGLCNFGLNTVTKQLLNLTPSTTYEFKMKAFYCGGTESNYSTPVQFTTADICPDLTNLSVQTYTNNTSKAKFTWDTTGAYVFARITLRVDTSGANWQTAGGFGVYYPTLFVNKFGLQSGESYRAQGRTFCDPSITAYRSPTWTSPVFWTQPGTIRLEEGTSITKLNIYPNPSDNIFNISFNSETIQDLSIRIFNIIGSEIYIETKEQFIGEYTKQISLDNFGKGVYFLEIETSTAIVNKKLILQ